MHLAVVDTYSHVAGIGAGKRSLLHAVHETLDDSRDEAGVNRTTHDTVVDHELAAPFERYLLGVAYIHLEFLVAKLICIGCGHTLCIRLNDKVYLAKLTGTSRLLFMAVVGASRLGDGLSVGYSRLVKHNG